MFTGIILDIGIIAALDPQGEDVQLRIKTGRLSLQTLSVGDSVAVNGVCLTVVSLPGDGFCADVSAETLRCTTLGNLKANSRVNLETALTPTTALGGHLVSGHVDGIGQIRSYAPEGRSIHYEIGVPLELSRYIAHKGSVTVDGVSLTVNEAKTDSFTVNIIPHTLEQTVFADYKVNTPVNIEVDIIARYLERLIATR
jgi:riboflavin synthase